MDVPARLDYTWKCVSKVLTFVITPGLMSLPKSNKKRNASRATKRMIAADNIKFPCGEFVQVLQDSVSFEFVFASTNSRQFPWKPVIAHFPKEHSQTSLID